MPFFFILPLWLLLVLLAVPLFFVRRLRFVGTHVVLASTMAALLSFALSTVVLVGAAQLPKFKSAGFFIIGLYVVSILGGAAIGLLIGIVLAHRLNKRLAWWPVPRSPP